MHSYRQLPLWGPLGGFALAFAWVLPNAHQPWVAFHKDAYLAVLMAVICLVVFVKASLDNKRVPLPAVALLLLGFGVWAWAQYRLGQIPFFGEAYIGALYFWGAAITLLAAFTWERREPGASLRLIFIAILIGSFVTVGIMLAQWLQIALPFVWFSELAPDGRLVGNLNQPNNAATLLAWGLVAIFWLRGSGYIGNFVWIFASLPYLACLTLTGSRINYLSTFAVMLFGAVAAWRYSRWKAYRLPVTTLGAIFVAFVILHGLFGTAVADSNPFERQFAGARALAYRALSMAVLEQPWLGYGFNQTLYAQLEAKQLGYPLPAFFSWSHNFMLDIAVWFGLPALALAVGVAVRTGVRISVVKPTVNSISLCLALFILLAHAAVELPHAYAVFLLPGCFMLGSLLGLSGEYAWKVSAKFLAACTIALGVMLGVTIVDYLRVEKSFFDWRFKVQRVGSYHPISVPDVIALDQFRALIRGLRSADSPLNQHELARFADAVGYFPSPFALQHLVKLQISAGRLDDARATIVMAQAILSKPDNDYMAKQWHQLQAQDPSLRVVDWH
jgi:hypothetical protein